MKQYTFHEAFIGTLYTKKGSDSIRKYLLTKFDRPITEADVNIELTIGLKEYFKNAGYSNNSIILFSSIYHSTLRYLARRGYSIELNPEDSRAELAVSREGSEHIFLNKDEIKLIEEYTPKDSKERYARAAFLIGAYTGCRVSDAVMLSELNFRNGELSYTSKKTKITTRLPLHPIVPELVEVVKSKNYATDTISSLIKKGIRSICENVGITDEVVLFQKGKRMFGKRSDFVSSHTARRSFASNMYLDGWSLEQISKMMGHSNTEMTLKYMCISYADNQTGDKTYLKYTPKEKEPEVTNEDLVARQVLKLIESGVSEEVIISTMEIMSVSGDEVREIIRNHGEKKE